MNWGLSKMRNSEQVEFVLTEIVLIEIVLTEIEKSNTVWDEIFAEWSRSRDEELRIIANQQFILTWTCWDEILSKWTCENEIFSAWTCEDEIFSWWSRLRKVIKICGNTVSWTWDRILSEWSSSRKIVYWTCRDDDTFLCISLLFDSLDILLKNEISFDQSDNNHVSLENEIFLYQSDNTHLISFDDEVSLDQNEDEISLHQSDKNDNNHLSSFDDEISLDQSEDEISFDQSDKSDNNHLISFEILLRSLIWDILLRISIEKILSRVLMMKAENSVISCSFVMNRIAFWKITVIWDLDSRSLQIQLEFDLIICWTFWYQENFE
jgi:hypothetical protein